jgi:isoleucyl-tRNA synthetase
LARHSEADIYILDQLKKNIEKCNELYSEYKFNEIVALINAHIVELSG